MSEIIVVALINNLPAILGALAAAIAAVAGCIAAWKGHQNSDKLATMHNDINGRMTQLIASKSTAAFAAGIKQEQENPLPPNPPRPVNGGQPPLPHD